jgi:hypothetical protein
VISPTLKPVTLSLNVMVTGIGDSLVGSATVEEMTTVGATLSYVLERRFEAVLPLLVASTATLAATLTVTDPAAVGVMLAV